MAIELTEKQGHTILNLAKEGKIYDGVVPQSKQELIKEAKKIYYEAYEAFKSGAKGDLIASILFTAQPEQSSVEEENPVNDVINKIGQEMPLFGDISGEPPDLPKDFSEISDKRLRQLHAEYTAFLVRANWLLAVEEAKLQYADRMIDLFKTKAISKLSKELDPLTEKPKTILILETEASQSESVVRYRREQADRVISVRLYKAIKDNYSAICERLSREWTMRESERR